MFNRFDVSVRTVKATPWVPANHLILRKTLSDEDFLIKIISKLPARVNVNENTFSVFSNVVSVKEVNKNKFNNNRGCNDNHIDDTKNIKNDKNNDNNNDNNDKESNVEKKAPSSAMKTRSKEKQDKSESELNKTKQSFSEEHVLVEWSDGSYATVNSHCGRLTRYVSSLFLSSSYPPFSFPFLILCFLFLSYYSLLSFCILSSAFPFFICFS